VWSFNSAYKKKGIRFADTTGFMPCGTSISAYKKKGIRFADTTGFMPCGTSISAYRKKGIRFADTTGFMPCGPSISAYRKRESSSQTPPALRRVVLQFQPSSAHLQSWEVEIEGPHGIKPVVSVEVGGGRCLFL
jgi:hypothetical protein